MTKQRGYFGIGAEDISKAGNLGNLVRSAHAFGASFFFTIGSDLNKRDIRSADTSNALESIPFYEFNGVTDFQLPEKCALVAVEFVENSIELPSFRHPTAAAYVLGPEMGNVSDGLMERADHVIKIPMQFCINVGVAGAIVMYDRLISTGKFAPRPVMAGGPSPDDIENMEHSASFRRFIRSQKSE